jgi:hypothetical protein
LVVRKRFGGSIDGLATSAIWLGTVILLSLAGSDLESALSQIQAALSQGAAAGGRMSVATMP